MSTATHLLDALVSAITTAAPGTFSSEFTAGRGWLTEGDRVDPETTVNLSWEAWRLLGAAGTLRLEQHVVGLLLQAPAADTSNATIDPFATLRAELIDFLEAWHEDERGYRVVAIQSPAPHDRAKLVAPGLWQSRLLLDCDILRTVGADDPPEAPEVSPVLATARSAVWDAIDHFAALEERFVRKFASDADLAELLLRDPAPHELPAVALTWQAMPTDWWTNQQQQWQPTLAVTLWLPATWHAAAEHLAQQVCLAVYRATPEASTVPYVKAATGHHPKRSGPINVQPVVIGRSGLTQAIRVDVSFVLRTNLNPFEGG